TCDDTRQGVTAPRLSPCRTLPVRATDTFPHSAFDCPRRSASVMRGWAERRTDRLSRWNHAAHLHDSATELLAPGDRGGHVLRAWGVAERATAGRAPRAVPASRVLNRRAR